MTNYSEVHVDSRAGWINITQYVTRTNVSHTDEIGEMQPSAKCTGLTNMEAMHGLVPNSHQRDVAQRNTITPGAEAIRLACLDVRGTSFFDMSSKF